MANSTDAYWDIDGTSLNQFGWSAKSIGAGVSLPTFIGEDLAVANRPGVRHVAKTPGPRTISLGMWMTGTEPGTGERTGGLSNAMHWNKNWDTLRALVFRENAEQVTLTRRWYKVTGYTPALLTASALAEHVGTLEPGMMGRSRCDFIMEFLLADPYFYKTTANTATWPSGTSMQYSYNSGDVTVWNSNNFTFTFTGPWTSPHVSNAIYSPNVWFQYGASIAAGETVTVNIGDFTAVSSVYGNVNGRITHGGDRPWMRLAKGANWVTVSGPGSGSCVMSYKEPYV